MNARGRRVQARAESRRLAKSRRQLMEKLSRDAGHQSKIKNDDQISIDLEELHRTGRTQIKGFRSNLYGPSSE